MKKFSQIIYAVSAATLLLTLGTAATPAKKPSRPVIACPQKPDPPPVIDGDCSEWDNLPGAIELNKSHVTWGLAQYQGEEDLSGTVRICYDANYFYFMVEVVDEAIKVASDKDIFVSDHIELDFAPNFKEGVTGRQGADWRIIGFTPGSVEESGDPLADMEADALMAFPPNFQWEGIDVESAITEDGYVIEARIPWKVLGVKGAVKAGMEFGMDIHISDSDKDFVQECMTSLNNTTPWKGRKLENIPKMVLTGTDGKIKK